MKAILAAVLSAFLLASPAAAKEPPVPPRGGNQEMPEKPKPPAEKPKEAERGEPGASIEVPKSVIDISKANTYPNPNENAPELQPSPLTKALLKSANVPIENPMLIRMLNESVIHPSKFSIGYQARVYLGKWPLNYQSNKTSVNWEYKKVNENRLDNRGSEQLQTMSYRQERQIKVTGGLTVRVPDQREVMQLMLMKAAKETDLPIAFSTVVGVGTKIDRYYNVQPKKVGYLSGYVPAVNEKGKVTYGEVYLVLDGGNKRLEVKNVMQQGIGAWIPVQDHIALRYHVAN